MYDPSTPYNDPNLTAAQTSADNAANTAVQYQSASSVLPNLLKTAINEKIDYNKGLIEAKNKSMVDYFNAPSAARLQYQDIFNPFQREALVQQSTNNAYLPYANNQDALTQRMGSLSDIINAATGTFGAQANAAQGAASLAQNRYSNLFSLAGAKSQGLAAQQAQKNWEYEQTHSASGGSGGLGDLTPTVPTNNEGTKSPPTEPQPINLPPNGPQYANTKWRSPEGQWEWNNQYQAWVPAGESSVTNEI